MNETHNNDIEKMAAITSWRCMRKCFDTSLTKTNNKGRVFLKSFQPFVARLSAEIHLRSTILDFD